METFEELGRRLSNWGRWGPDDRRGTLNHLTPERVLAARESIRSGRVFELSLPLGKGGPQQGGGRFNPIHTMTMLPGDWDLPDGSFIVDDQVTMPLQCATQWDGLGHVGYADRLYNDVPAAATVTARRGAIHNGIEAMAPGMVGRGVLLDVARLRGVDWIAADDDRIGPDELDRAARAQGVEVRPGDAVLVRTGWRRKAVVEGSTPEWITVSPGLDLACAEWLHGHDVATVASDNWAVEAMPSPVPGSMLPLHCVLIRDLGMMLGEMFDLEALAEDCAADGRWDVFLSAPPLRVTGGVGSPAAPVAIK
ncbi:cyclase family protein [Trujillonella endophytica]|uniref:Kynurenine formamidase n=1 Tax=Trujillonella endophytica TaxID=673521 RepID=A0A1H8Q6X6_9ACTN|nr:cyclase family protein [Trujillella endophytica]SEO49684.1 Kynurenine formamidase [Trujillella endophytica]